MNFLDLDDLRLTFDSSVKRTKRRQQISFGDGYSQILSDGLNAEREVWTCVAPTMEESEAFSVEAYLNRNADQALLWSPPDSTKTYVVQFQSGTVELGYINLSSLSLSGYTRPTNYTANLSTGLLTSVDIPNNKPVKVTLTESAKRYILKDGWKLKYVAPGLYDLEFELERVYV